MTEQPRPWWETDQELRETIRRSLEEFEREGEELRRARGDRNDGPDPVVAEIMTGSCRRLLAAARDNLDDARIRYDEAVHKARSAGYSWGEIGRILGVPKQSLHRRFR